METKQKGEKKEVTKAEEKEGLCELGCWKSRREGNKGAWA